MKKLLFAGAFALLGITTMNAQRVEEGDLQVNAGIGFSNGWTTPVYAGLDYGVHKDISVGFEGSFASNENTYGDKKLKETWYSIGVNGNYHFNSLLKIPNNWDVYAGLNLAYNGFSVDAGFADGHSSGVGLGAQIGARYYFTPNFGLNVQFGGGDIASGGRVGISYKF